MSPGDVYVVRTAATLSTVVCYAVMTHVEPENDKYYTLSAMAGMAAGLYGGEKLVLDKDYTMRQALKPLLGMTSGATVGLAVYWSSHTGSSTKDLELKTPLTYMTAGMVTGFTLFYMWTHAEVYSSDYYYREDKYDFSINPGIIILRQPDLQQVLAIKTGSPKTIPYLGLNIKF